MEVDWCFQLMDIVIKRSIYIVHLVFFCIRKSLFTWVDQLISDKSNFIVRRRLVPVEWFVQAPSLLLAFTSDWYMCGKKKKKVQRPGGNIRNYILNDCYCLSVRIHQDNQWSPSVSRTNVENYTRPVCR